MKTLSVIFSIIALLIYGEMKNSSGIVAGSNKGSIYNGTGQVSFFSESPISNVVAHSMALKSKLNTETNEISFEIPMNSFVFKNQKMQKDFYSHYMDVTKYPKATYKGK